MGEREGRAMLEFDGQSALASSVAIISSPSSSYLPLNLHPPLPFLAAAGTVSKLWDAFSFVQPTACVRFRVMSGNMALSKFDQKCKKCIPANKDMNDCLQKVFELY